MKNLLSRCTHVLVCMVLLWLLVVPALCEAKLPAQEIYAAAEIDELFRLILRQDMTYEECDRKLKKIGYYGKEHDLYYIDFVPMDEMEDFRVWTGFWLHIRFSDVQSVALQFYLPDDHPCWASITNDRFWFAVYDLMMNNRINDSEMRNAVLQEAYYVLYAPSDAYSDEFAIKLAIDLEYYSS